STATHSYGVDTTAPELTVSVDAVTSDNVINAAESGASVNVTGAVSGEFNDGDAVTLTVNSVAYTGTVGADGAWTIAVAGSDLAAADSLGVSVTTTDAAGNSTTTTATHAYSVDTAAPELTVSVDSITADNVINAAESGAATIAVSGTVGAEAGVSTTVTITVNGQDYTAAVDTANGTWAVDVAASDLLADSAVAVSATSTDVAGNSTTATTSHGYSVDTAAPELTVSVDAITSDNVINAAESGAATIAVSGTVGAEAGVSTTVTITVNGQDYTAAVDTANGTWAVDVAASDLLADSAVAVSATSTDVAGNSTTATTSHGYSVDTAAPELTVSVDAITSDNVINAAESGAATIAVSGTVGAEAGASTTVTITVNGQDYTAAVDTTNGTWAVDVATGDLLADNSVAVSATSTDAAGNSTTTTTTHGYGVDTAAPELTVSVDSITSDNVVNAAESGTSVNVTGTVVGEFNEGDVVTLTVGGTSLTGAVGADGTWTIAVPGSDLAGSSSLDVSVTTTDAAGNSTTTTATHSYGVDTAAPELTVSVDPVTSDNVINAAESGTSVDVTGKVTGEFNEGDVVSLTVGSTSHTGAVGADGSWTIAVAGSDLAAADSLGVSVTTTDAAGNSTTSTATHAYGVDTTAPELAVSVDPITADNVINAAESDVSVGVTGTVTGEFNEGDVVTLTVNGAEYSGTVAQGGTWAITVAGSDLAASSSLGVSVTTSDAAGNSTTATTSHGYSVDTTAPELTVSVDPVTSDNVINAAESGASVNVTGAMTGEFNEGDVVTLTVGDTSLTGTVGADGTWTIAVAGSDLAAADSLDVSVTTTDAAGNSTTATTSHGYSVDTAAPELTVSVDPVTSDNVINAAESGASVNVTGKVTGEFNEGDAVTLTVGNTSLTGAVGADGSWTIAVAGADLAAADSLDVSVTTADAAGNSTTSTATHSYGVDTAAPELTVSVDPVTSDNVINAAESGTSVNVTGTVTGEFNEGDVVTLTVGNTSLTGAVGADGTWTIAVAGSDLAASSSLGVSVTTADAAGNSTTTTTTHGYGVDTAAPELTVSVNPITADNVINAAESGTSVNVTGTVTGEFNEGDVVTLTVGGTSLTGTVGADGTWTIAVAGSDLAAAGSLSVSVTTTDAAGNSTTSTTTHSYGVDTTAPELAVSVDPITADNVINAAESGASVDVTGTVSGEFNEGDVVTLTVGNTSLTGTVGADGTWTIAVAGSDLAASSSLGVSVTTTDAAGNSTTTTTTHGYGVDTAAPELTVSVNPITADNVINAAESGTSVNVTGTVSGEFNEGDVVTLTVGSISLTGAVGADGTWTIAVAGSDLAAADSLSVSVTTTDAAGNSTTTTAAHGYGVDTTAPELTVSVDPVTSDNVINAAESGAATIAVSGTVGAEAGASTTVTITVNG
ncbi:Ig-like domain-containing protein, partial [Castellaniella sp. GW247-6E4]|uniref:Ig-like domain-containing protein n=1 Tax=Castellaniella sp. GW247-6E4 TaxID=3140380 RepID=UPI0033149BCC